MCGKVRSKAPHRVGYHTVYNRMLLSFFPFPFSCCTHHNHVEAGALLETSPTAQENDVLLGEKGDFVFDDEGRVENQWMGFVS